MLLQNHFSLNPHSILVRGKCNIYLSKIENIENAHWISNLIRELGSVVLKNLVIFGKTICWALLGGGHDIKAQM